MTGGDAAAVLEDSPHLSIFNSRYVGYSMSSVTSYTVPVYNLDLRVYSTRD